MDRYINTPAGMVDADTGELVEMGENGKPTKQASTRAPIWFKGYRKGFAQLATAGLSASDCAVLFSLMGRVRFGNTLIINQQHIADEVGLSRSSVVRAVAALERHKIILRLERSKKSGTYKIEKAYCWCGEEAPAKS